MHTHASICHISPTKPSIRLGAMATVPHFIRSYFDRCDQTYMKPIHGGLVSATNIPETHDPCFAVTLPLCASGPNGQYVYSICRNLAGDARGKRAFRYMGDRTSDQQSLIPTIRLHMHGLLKKPPWETAGYFPGTSAMAPRLV